MSEQMNNSQNMVPSPDTTVHEPVVSDSVPIKDEAVDLSYVLPKLQTESPIEPKVNKRARPRPDYMRHVKSPFSYVEMISYVIESNTGTMLTLRDIISLLSKTFPCLGGDYVGWKNSVRHTLSINECFTKILRRPDRPYGKDNFWIMNIDCSHCKLSRTEKDLEIRYQHYIKQTGETDFSTQKFQRRATHKHKRASSQAAVPPVSRSYQSMYPSQVAIPNFLPVMHRSAPMDLTSTSQNKRKRQLLDNEPLDLSVKKFKSSPSPTPDYSFVKEGSPASSSNGSCSPDFRRSYSPQFMTRYSPDRLLFRSELHFPENVDRSRFMNNMTGRMYEYGQDGSLQMVQNIDDARRPIYVLSSIPAPSSIRGMFSRPIY